MTTIKTALFSVSVRNISQRKDLMVQGFFSSGEETVPSRSMSGLQGTGSAPPSSSLAATTAFAYFCSFGSPGYLFEALTNWSCDRSSKVDPLKAPPAITRRPCLALIECISGAPVSNKRAWSTFWHLKQSQVCDKVFRHDKLQAKRGYSFQPRYHWRRKPIHDLCWHGQLNVMLQGFFYSPPAHKPKSTNGNSLSIIHGGSPWPKTGRGEVAVQDAQFFAYLFEHPAEESTTSFPQSAVISLLNHFSQSLDCTRVPNQHKLIYTKLPSVLSLRFLGLATRIAAKGWLKVKLPGREMSVCFNFSNSPGLSMQRTPISSKVAKTRHLFWSSIDSFTEEWALDKPIIKSHKGIGKGGRRELVLCSSQTRRFSQAVLILPFSLGCTCWQQSKACFTTYSCFGFKLLWRCMTYSESTSSALFKFPSRAASEQGPCSRQKPSKSCSPAKSRWR